MLSKLECYQRLSELKSKGINVTEQVIKLNSSNEISNSVIDFIESHNQTEADKFFEHLREMHNKKNHKLYSNILNENLDEVGKLKCLSSYMTTACISLESMDSPERCLELRKSIGLEKVSEALYKYYNGIDFNAINEALEYIRSLLNKKA